MREVTLEQFRALFPHCPLSTATEQLPLLNATMRQYRINNKRRIAAFCATLAQESGEFRYRTELASGADYEGRRDLGNEYPGDGRAFKGHGRIQITGRANHTAYTLYILKSGHVPFVDFRNAYQAHRLADDPYALDSSGWFWSVLHDLNSLADADNFLKTQIKVNGRNRRTGLPNHWKERNDYYQRALRILPDDVGFDDLPDAGPAIDVEAVVNDAPVTAEATTTPAAPVESASVMENGLLNKAMASDGAKQAGKTVLIRLARPLGVFLTALEAGNAYAWLGAVVLVVGAGVVIYYEREQLKRLAVRLTAKVKGK
jgi:predicted chitinase